MLIAFEKSTHEKDLLRRKIMEYGSGGKIIHCQFICNEEGYNNACLAAWEGYGVAVRPLESTIRYYDEYEFYDLGTAHTEETYQFFRDNLGTEYSLLEIFIGMVLSLGKDNPRYKFCSEMCAIALTKIYQLPLNVGDEYNRVSPQKLRDNFIKLGYQPIKFNPNGKTK